MSETKTADNSLTALLDRMVATRQLSTADAAIFRKQPNGDAAVTEDEILEWLGQGIHTA